ncbi:hypothetical protein [Sorangium cellulosum]|uniref:hypothetical protein n=1 Tax=Sorangium cellulosum TaxID=56 RepID=UPI0012FF5FA6|nr:hypothetical protein [Sorangium cellulosum]
MGLEARPGTPSRLAHRLRFAMVPSCNRRQKGIEHDRRLVERFQDLTLEEGLAEIQLGAGALDVEAVGRAVVDEGVSGSRRLKSGEAGDERKCLNGWSMI